MFKFKNLLIDELARLNTMSIFDERTDKASATQYFQVCLVSLVFVKRILNFFTSEEFDYPVHNY